MILTLRRRPQDQGPPKTDVVLASEGGAESEVLDALGDTPDDDGLIATGVYEVRLSDDVGTHYVLLKDPTGGGSA